MPAVVVGQRPGRVLPRPEKARAVPSGASCSPAPRGCPGRGRRRASVAAVEVAADRLVLRQGGPRAQ
eukprot:5780431-Heterocapsa_arctica.AAC.1